MVINLIFHESQPVFDSNLVSELRHLRFLCLNHASAMVASDSTLDVLLTDGLQRTSTVDCISVSKLFVDGEEQGSQCLTCISSLVDREELVRVPVMEELHLK